MVGGGYAYGELLQESCFKTRVQEENLSIGHQSPLRVGSLRAAQLLASIHFTLERQPLGPLRPMGLI